MIDPSKNGEGLPAGDGTQVVSHQQERTDTVVTSEPGQDGQTVTEHAGSTDEVTRVEGQPAPEGDS